MAADYYDKLQIDTTVKLAFPGIELKEVKLPGAIPVEISTKRRMEISQTAKGDVCQNAELIKEFPALDAKDEFVLIVVKMPKIDANKNAVKPVYVGNVEFKPNECDKCFKLEGDAPIAFWKTPVEKVQTNPDRAKPLYVFNPNLEPVVLDVFFGSSKVPPP